ncbi:related to ribosomal protein L19, mitochondrial [Rhynchosporium agropyri]|uniref:Related to ribosomal protein L19, mitochondrial n=2 Tax=Rhynchosporium TaxID=38037 RepID=A0A1E1LQL3_9HELO|nr:related to ribosomal protein L19, mitochondrial [Rhynchosporium commune]CZT12793.1 related to ribosomal protein L19, mitochondrial [Rhynchosporium agropyri]
MSTITPTLRPLSCWKSILRHSRQEKATARSLTTYHTPASHVKKTPPPPGHVTKPAAHRAIKIKLPPFSFAKICREPMKAFTQDQISILDPTGARSNLFSRANTEAAKVGDVLLVRLKTGDPFAGVCINIRRRGVDSAILLRNELTRVGVEMWYKIYSPNVEGIEVVQRREKRARRARLTYMRKPKHDMGSVQNIVLAYQRSRGALRGAGLDQQAKGGVRKKGKGKKK